MRVSPIPQLVLCLCLLCALASACRATEGRQIPANETLKKPGDFIWAPEQAKDGDVSIVVNLPRQELHVYKGAVRIASSTISSGRRGRSSPPGVYSILEKQIFHRSNLYQNAPMPFMQRLTWCGVAMHAGLLPGYPASHGCLRLPNKFAKLLYEYTNCGLPVVVTNAPVEPERPPSLPAATLEPVYPQQTQPSLQEIASSIAQNLDYPEPATFLPAKEEVKLTSLSLAK